MSDEAPRRIADPAVAEMVVNGRLLYRLEQRKESNLNDVETAAAVVPLLSLASTLESVNLDRPAGDVLEEADYEFDLHDDQPRNVE